jgi:hypothetical protein
MIMRILKMSSNPGDTILDPFVGSGTSLVAAKLLDKIALFPTDGELDEITVDFGGGATLYATNLKPGKWFDGHNGFVVEESEKMLVVKASGKKTYKRVSKRRSISKT